MKTAIYCRVSTLDQTNGQQEMAIRRMLKPEDGEPVVFAETVSGDNYKERPLYDQLVQLVEGFQVKTVWVWAIDRLGRDAREVYKFACMCADRKVSLRSVTEPQDFTTLDGLHFLHGQATYAQKELERIRDRTQNGIDIMKKEFEYHGHGSPAGWFSAKVIEQEDTIRDLFKSGWKPWRIAKKLKLDFESVKKVLAAKPGSLMTKAQLVQERPRWYKTPKEQREEYLAKKKKQA